MHQSFCCCLWNAFEHIACSDDLFIPYAGPLTPVKRIGPSWNPRGCTMHRGAVVTFLQNMGHSEPDVTSVFNGLPTATQEAPAMILANLHLHHSWVRKLSETRLDAPLCLHLQAYCCPTQRPAPQGTDREEALEIRRLAGAMEASIQCEPPPPPLLPPLRPFPLRPIAARVIGRTAGQD